jgi:hypothetical protein
VIGTLFRHRLASGVADDAWAEIRYGNKVDALNGNIRKRDDKIWSTVFVRPPVAFVAT